MSYREAILGLRLGRSGLMLLERYFDLCRCKNDLNIYILSKANDQMVLLRYVDDCDCPRQRPPRFAVSLSIEIEYNRPRRIGISANSVPSGSCLQPMNFRTPIATGPRPQTSPEDCTQSRIRLKFLQCSDYRALGRCNLQAVTSTRYGRPCDPGPQ